MKKVINPDSCYAKSLFPIPLSTAVKAIYAVVTVKTGGPSENWTETDEQVWEILDHCTPLNIGNFRWIKDLFGNETFECDEFKATLKDGKLHNEKGPAVVWNDGEELYFLKGSHIVAPSKDAFVQFVKEGNELA